MSALKSLLIAFRLGGQHMCLCVCVDNFINSNFFLVVVNSVGKSMRTCGRRLITTVNTFKCLPVFLCPIMVRACACMRVGLCVRLYVSIGI